MNLQHIKLLIVLPVCCLLLSCSKQEEELMEEPFIHIMFDGTNQVQVNSNRRDVVSYYIYFSTKPTTETLEVNYSVIPGEGLEEGRDYELITTENPLTFPSGIYQRPVQIRWLENSLDSSLDNSLRIVLEDNNLGVHTGLPGPDANQSELKITKVNN